MDASELSEAGLFGPTRARASVRDTMAPPGASGPARILTARLFDSLECELLPSRGFDIGDTWFRGVPVSWFSPVTDARALPRPSGADWLARFNGGLVTTCGFDSIGAATGTQGLHGDASHIPAEQISWRIADDGIEFGAVIESLSLFGPSFRIKRSTSVPTGPDGTGHIYLDDAVTNVGNKPAPLHLLYHVNLGAPLVAPGTRVEIARASTAVRVPVADVPDWYVLPDPTDRVVEVVFEHSGAEVDEHGFAAVTLTSPIRDLAARIRWDATALPRLYQWVFPTRGRWGFAIEPSTAPLFGPARSEAAAGAPLISPRAQRTQRLRIDIGTRAGVQSESAR